MQTVINRVNENDLSIESITNKLSNILPNRFNLIKGDAIFTSKRFAEENPGTRIKILYLDMDLEEPTYYAIKNLWDKIVLGGKIICDEYGYGAWTESNGVDDFLKTINGKYILETTGIISPTVVITKINL